MYRPLSLLVFTVLCEQDLACGRPARSWAHNTALYGSVTATIAYSLALESPQHVAGYRSTDPLKVVVSVRDFHNQTILGERVVFYRGAGLMS
jgi:hypothetical protein